MALWFNPIEHTRQKWGVLGSTTKKLPCFFSFFFVALWFNEVEHTLRTTKNNLPVFCSVAPWFRPGGDQNQDAAPRYFAALSSINLVITIPTAHDYADRLGAGDLFAGLMRRGVGASERVVGGERWERCLPFSVQGEEPGKTRHVLGPFFVSWKTCCCWKRLPRE